MHGRIVLVVAALLAAMGVGLGAYAAHGLAAHIESLGHVDEIEMRIRWFETGVRYQLYHALAILLVVLLAAVRTPNRAFRFATAAFLVGVLLFSGSLYAMTVLPAEWKKLGAVVPLGGVAFLVGWVAVAYAAWNSQESDS